MKKNKKNNEKLYKRFSTDSLKWKFLFYIFHFRQAVLRLWVLENIVEISIKRSERIDFDAKNGKIIFYQNDGEKSREQEIDREYLNKIIGGNKNEF